MKIFPKVNVTATYAFLPKKIKKMSIFTRCKVRIEQIQLHIQFSHPSQSEQLRKRKFPFHGQGQEKCNCLSNVHRLGGLGGRVHQPGPVRPGPFATSENPFELNMMHQWSDRTSIQKSKRKHSSSPMCASLSPARPGPWAARP